MKKITLNELKALDLNDLYKFYVELDNATRIKDDKKRNEIERSFFADGEYWPCISYIVNHKALYLKRTEKSRAETAAMTKAFSFDRSRVSVVSEFC